MVSRRSVIAASLGAGIAAITTKHGLAIELGEPEDIDRFEEQFGEPGLEPERVRLNHSVIDAALAGKLAALEPYIDDFGPMLVSCAESFVGMNRKSDKSQIEEMCALFNLPYSDSNGLTAFCACGASYAAALAYTDVIGKRPANNRPKALQKYLLELHRYYFHPTMSVRDMYHVSVGTRRWIDFNLARFKAGEERVRSLIEPGWLVVYDFGSNGGFNHVGIVKAAEPAGLRTIEFNTTQEGVAGSESNGGHVAERLRPYSKIIRGFVTIKRTAF
jgi:hypothetical protein